MSRVSLARSATGLPRYYLDTGWWRAPSFRKLPLDALGLWVCMVGAAHEHGTDGRFPADPEDLAAVVGLRVSRVKRPLDTLLKAGRLVVDGDQVVLAGYSDHNPTADEIDDYTRMRSRQGTKGNHVRWHQNKGVTDPNCPYCHRSSDPKSDRPSDRNEVIEDRQSDDQRSVSDALAIDQRSISDRSGSTFRDEPGPESERNSNTAKHETAGQTVNGHRSSDRPSDPGSDPPAIANRSHGMGWDGIDTQVSSPTGLGTGRDPTTDDDSTDPPPPNLDGLARLVAKARSKRLGGHHSPAWIRAVALGLDEHCLADLGRAGHTATEIDLILDGRPPPGPDQATPHPAVHAASHQCDNPDCAGGMTLDDDAIARPCPVCQGATV